MTPLAPHDIAWCVRRLPKQVVALMKEHPSIILAGGYIRSVISNERVNDLDLFTSSADASKLAADALKDRVGEIFTTDNAHTVRMRGAPMVQFIHRWSFTTPEQCLESFDFTIACAAIWHADKQWHGACDPQFYQDLAAKRLVYRSPQRNEDAGGSMLRVLKFYQCGYRIPLDSMGAVIARLVGGVDAKALEGMEHNRGLTHEQAMAKALTGLLREVDPLIDPSGLAHLPSLQADADAGYTTEPVDDTQQ